MRTRPIRSTKIVIPPLMSSHVASPHEDKGIPGKIRYKGTTSRINPNKIFIHLLMGYGVQIGLKRF